MNASILYLSFKSIHSYVLFPFILTISSVVDALTLTVSPSIGDVEGDSEGERKGVGDEGV